MCTTARVVMLVCSTVAICFIIATAAADNSVTKACFVSLDHPIVLNPTLPAVTELPMPATGLFRGKQSFMLFGEWISLEIKTKDLDEVSTLFKAAQAFAIMSAITFFAASCVGMLPQSVGRFAGFIHLFGALFAVICGSILLGAVHKNLINDDSLLHSSDNDHSLSECSLNYGIPFIFVAAGLGIVNCLLFCLTGWTDAAPANNIDDVEAVAPTAHVVHGKQMLPTGHYPSQN